MCGIVGIAAADGQSMRPLQAAVDRIAHRGPDGQGIFKTERVAIGHTRLAIIDLTETGAQPMISHDGRFVMTYNGEIYNYAELRTALIERGVKFRGASDSEVLLEGFVHFGLDVLDWLNGIFAFAILEIATGEVVIARDQLGIKPLYWSEGKFGFAFSSEIKALVAAAPIDKTIDRMAVEQHLTYIWSPGERTLFDSVKKLDPGTVMLIRNGRVARTSRYWAPPRYNPRKDWTKGECAADLAACVTGAVHRQLVADVPVGAFLSGGVDSTAIVAAARQLKPDIKCYTMAIKGSTMGEMADDLSYARIAAQNLNVSLTEVEVAPSDILNNIEHMILELDEPLADPACLNLRFMAEAARKDGIKVLLSGTGGDDLMSGYRRHFASKYNGVWDYAPKWLRGSVAGGAAKLTQSSTITRQIKKYLRDIDRDHDSRIASLFAWCRPEIARDLMSNPASDPRRPFDVLQQWLDGMEGLSDIEKCLGLDRRFFLADHNLTYTDKMGMAVGTEIRVPLLDLEVVRFAATIPSDWKCNGRDLKWMFKQSQIGRVPDAILNRPKTGFGVPLRGWLNNELLPMAQDLLSPNTLKNRGLFDPDKITRLFAENAAGRVDATYTLFSAMCIELWCKNFVDG
jgi:asparagine synthase (glutamine-hydrolysing)